MADRTPPVRRHPLCTCPEWQPDFKGTPPPDRSQCRGGDIAHPVLDGDQMREIVQNFRDQRGWS